ncbi:MFS transporter [Rhizobium lusitanum]|uniref:MFS family permease n=1 Tax=Rhizobium lusitanum TaxID=293958 RepID=A0A7X0J0V2_9HYPH|nr:MFS transporter [Rhizobium lusitanum]MBB6489316.1 MFS family permease [Rhizobium lusitanum]
MPSPKSMVPSYTLGVLTIAYILSYLDRQILGLLVEPLRQDLHLTDLQIGLLQGFTFAIVLAASGLPLGRWVDTGNRVRIAAIGIAFWSIMTAACGFAGSFEALLLCRAGVALGEAALAPAAYSLISDLFPMRRRGFAIGVFSSGAYIGAGLSLVLSATVLHQFLRAESLLQIPGIQHVWQIVFVVVGIPGIAVALWVASLREPQRQSGSAPSTIPGAPEIRAYYADNRVQFASLYLCLAFAAIEAYSYSAWVPSVLIRTFQMPPTDVGFVLGPLFIASSVSGLIFGATLGDSLVRRGIAAARPMLMCSGALAASLFTAALPFAPSLNAALTLISIATFLSTIIVANGPPALQDITPARMRGVTSAIGVMIVTLIGMGLGPTLVGFVSQTIIGDPKAIGIAVSIVSTIGLVSSSAVGLVASFHYRLGSDNGAPSAIKEQAVPGQ